MSLIALNSFVASIPMVTLWMLLFLVSILVGLFSGRVLWLAGDYVEVDPFVGKALDIFLGSLLAFVVSGISLLTYPIWR